MHGDDISGANTMVEGATFQGFIDFEMSRLGNELYLLGTALQWACLDNPSQWAPMRDGYEAERGTPMDREMVALLKLFAPFSNWCRFAWWWGSDDQPAWVWERNARGRTLNELLKTIAVVDSVVG
jgi:Ser/Thr protein kinase RdoA (MazF antagonist)